MKKFVFLLAISCCSTVSFANCTNAYASAGYGLSHARKSMEANNFDHQQYYAERALKAFQKAREENETCGCPDASDPILDGIENLRTALNQEKWDNARYFTKKALENAEKVLYTLDMCALGEEPAQEVTVPNNDQTTEVADPAGSENPLDAEELEAKLRVKEAAEDELQVLEKSIRNLASIFECEKAKQIVRDLKSGTEHDLKSESLSAVRSFYRSQAVALHNKALFALLECSKK